MSTYTIKLSIQQIQKLKTKSLHAKVCKTPPYALYQIKTNDCTITAYESLKVVFQGEGASFYASNYGEIETKTPTIAKPVAAKIKIAYPQCGSDEVGTGDYFGPVVVCATCIKAEDLDYLKQYAIQDSKQIKDSDILVIAPKLMERLTYSLLILSNEKYNQVHETNNMNAIKAKLHNQAFLHLEKKLQEPLQHVIVDQFTPEKSYYNYLTNEPNVFNRIHFETKAESKYLSVACASMIARYHFLLAMDNMSEKYDFPFPKGAGKGVDELGVKFLHKYDEPTLYKVCKYHFKNTQKVHDLMK